MRIYSSEGAIKEPKFLTWVDVVGTTTYLGKALPGSLTSSPVFQIQKLVQVGQDITPSMADGDDAFDNVWDDRLSLSYS